MMLLAYAAAIVGYLAVLWAGWPLFLRLAAHVHERRMRSRAIRRLLRESRAHQSLVIERLQTRSDGVRNLAPDRSSMRGAD
jgi:hypothetical protein